MPRVKKELVDAVASEIAKLEENDPSVISTCGLCNRTLYDNLTQIVVKTGAPERTVCNVFADFYNEEKRHEDQVEGKTFQMRLLRMNKANESELIATERGDNSQDEERCLINEKWNDGCETEETPASLESPQSINESCLSVESRPLNETIQDDVLSESRNVERPGAVKSTIRHREQNKRNKLRNFLKHIREELISLGVAERQSQ